MFVWGAEVETKLTSDAPTRTGASFPIYPPADDHRHVVGGI